MKLLRLGAVGSEIPCILDENNIARNASSIVSDFTPDTIPNLKGLLSGVSIELA